MLHGVEKLEHRCDLRVHQYLFDALVGARDDDRDRPVVAKFDRHPADDDQDADAVRGHRSDLGEVKDDPLELAEGPWLEERFTVLDTFEVVGSILVEFPFERDHENIAPRFHGVFHDASHCSHHLRRFEGERCYFMFFSALYCGKELSRVA